MNKLTLTVILSFCFSIIYSQQNILVLKKKNRTIDKYWIGSVIAFQLTNMLWQKGEIIKIQNDSFYIKPVIVEYSAGAPHTFTFEPLGYSLSDVYALPKEGVFVEYNNGSFQISMSSGHQHFYWIKSGWIFKVGAAGYAALNVINGLIGNDFSFSDSKTPLGIATAVFLAGVLLHITYKLTDQISRKYHLQVINLSN
jgi:hypothetical protein